MQGGSDEPLAPPRELHHCFLQLCPEALYEALKTLLPAAPQSRRTEALKRDSGEGVAGVEVIRGLRACGELAGGGPLFSGGSDIGVCSPIFKNRICVLCIL